MASSGISTALRNQISVKSWVDQAVESAIFISNIDSIIVPAGQEQGLFRQIQQWMDELIDSAPTVEKAVGVARVD